MSYYYCNRCANFINAFRLPQEFYQIGKALNMPAEAVLSGVLLLLFASHRLVIVSGMQMYVHKIFAYYAELYSPGTM